VSSLHLVVPDALKVNVAVEEVVEFEGAEVIVTDGACCQCACCQCAGAPAAVPDRTSAASPKVEMRGTTFAMAKTFPAAAAAPGSHALTSATTRGSESLNRGTEASPSSEAPYHWFMATVPEVSRTTAIRMRENAAPLVSGPGCAAALWDAFPLALNSASGTMARLPAASWSRRQCFCWQ
jgi:hypothetical protein